MRNAARNARSGGGVGLALILCAACGNTSATVEDSEIVEPADATGSDSHTSSGEDGSPRTEPDSSSTVSPEASVETDDAPSSMDASEASTPLGDASPSGDAGPTSSAFHTPFDWNGIVGNGQSLAVGARGTPVITTTQPFQNLKLYDATGKYALDSSGTLSLVPLVEPIRPICKTDSSPYPCNIYGETPHSALSIQLTTLAKAAGESGYVTLHSVVGQGSQPLSVISKQAAAQCCYAPSTNPGDAYAAGLSEARSFKKLADTAGKTFGYIGIVFTHGETDNGNAGGYEAGLFQLYQDYNTDLLAITGQKQPIVMVASQQVSSPPTGNGLRNTALGGTALALWQASLDHPGDIVCAGPKYQYNYYQTSANVTDPHVYPAGYRRLGEKYAEILDAIANRGETWTPLQPTTASIAGTSLTVHFSIPDPPLAWESSLAVSTTVSAWKTGRGFEVVDSTGPLTITDAAISGDSVVLSLAAAPTGSGLRVRYATYNGCTGNCGDFLLGQLRDSDPFPGADVQTISCTVTQGSTKVVCSGATSLASREVHDIVTGSGLAPDTVVMSTNKATQATLSNPWTGSSGSANLVFDYDERNYAVQFDIAVP